MEKKRIKSRFIPGLLCFLVFSATFVPMGTVTELEGQAREVGVAALGVTFWLSLILGIVLSARAAALCRCAGGGGTRGSPWRFFSNAWGCVADAVILIALGCAAAIVLHPPEAQWLYLGELGLLSLGVSMHCLFNSNTFRFIYKGSGDK